MRLAASLLLAIAAFGQTNDIGALVQKEFHDNERMLGAKVPEVFQALAVADVGAGPGDFTVLPAQLVGPRGRVYAVDIVEDTVKKLRERMEKRKMSNVEVILGAADDPKLPQEKLDAILIVDCYHEMPDYEPMLRHMLAALRRGGRLVIVDQVPGKTRNRPRASQVKNHKIAVELTEGELRKAGFEIAERRDLFVNNPDQESIQWMIVARRPGG